MKLHIGCFNTVLEGWYNTDITPHIFISRIPFTASLLHAAGVIDDARYHEHQTGVFRRVHYLDALKQFPFRDNTVEAVYSSQVLQNFSPDEAESFLRETRRILQPGGICRIAIADLDQWIASYDPMNTASFLALMFQPATKGQKNLIRWMYNEHSIKGLFQKTGFKNVMRCVRHRGRCPDVERIDYRTDAMFIEGEK